MKKEFRLPIWELNPMAGYLGDEETDYCCTDWVASLNVCSPD
jgi:hypothetical protein